MKKLNKLALTDAKVMTADQMKHTIAGGSYNYWIQCTNGNYWCSPWCEEYANPNCYCSYFSDGCR